MGALTRASDITTGGGGEAPSSRVPSRDERRLAARLARGDEAAIREIQSEYAGLVRGYLQQLLRDRAAAEDVLQQVMLEVWQRGRSFDPARSALSSWVMLIARSRAIDHLRRQLPEPHDPAVTASLVDRLARHEHEADEMAEQWRIAHLLTQLPREESLVLRMRFHEELSQSEIAAGTGIPLGTVKMRMVSGLARMRELMEQER
jgi:RNA polymerase sigma-70 factor (ECF subfamily)